MEPILILTDIDRTLIPNGHQPESVEARGIFKAFVKENNITLAYVSGRDIKLLQQAIEEYHLPMPDHAITDVGTAIYRNTGGEWRPSSAWQNKLAASWQNTPRETIITALQNITSLMLQEPEKQSPYKISYYASIKLDPEDLERKIEKRLADCPAEVSVVHSIDEVAEIGLFDILPSEATKFHAVKFLIHCLEIPEDRAIYSGDSGNDLQVLTSGVRSTLVANATSDVRRRATAAAPSDTLYIAQGNFIGMNGNYCAGILEGIAHFIPESTEIISQYSQQISCKQPCHCR